MGDASAAAAAYSGKDGGVVQGDVAESGRFERQVDTAGFSGELEDWRVTGAWVQDVIVCELDDDGDGAGGGGEVNQIVEGICPMNGLGLFVACERTGGVRSWDVAGEGYDWCWMRWM